MIRILNNISKIILDYQELKDRLEFDEGFKIQLMLKDLSSNLFFLQEHLTNERERYYNHLKVNIKDNMAVSRAEVLAKADVPEYDKLKQIVRRANSCFEAMRSNQSFIKEDLKHK